METAPGPALSDTDLARVIGGLNRACSDPHCLPAAAPMADRLWPAVSIDSNVGPVPADQRAA